MSKSEVLKSPASTKEIALPAALATIDQLTEQHAVAHNALANKMAELDGKIAALKADYLPGLRRLVSEVKATHDALNAAVILHADQFEKPRTRVLHGFTVGMRKLEGKTVFADEERSIDLIRKFFPGMANVLIAVKESIVKDMAAQLPAADLKKIGGEISDATDMVVIKSAAGDVVKLVDALIKEASAS